MTALQHRRPVITFHDINHARAIFQAARETGITVGAVSAPGAAGALGPAILKAIADNAGLDQVLIDCQSSSKSAQLALAAGWKHVLVAQSHPAFKKLAGMAEAGGSEVLPREAYLATAIARLDLLRQSDPLSCCKDFLKNFQR